VSVFKRFALLIGILTGPDVHARMSLVVIHAELQSYFLAQVKHHVSQQDLDDASLEMSSGPDTALEGTSLLSWREDLLLCVQHGFIVCWLMRVKV
jgi:hypothetical protein